jgi:hypothetical protein
VSTAVNRSKIWIRLVKIILVAVVTVILLFMLGVFLVSYKVVGALSQPKKTIAVITSPANKLTTHRSKDVLEVAGPKPVEEDQTSKETKKSDINLLELMGRLEELDSIKAEMETKTRPGMCEILCKESSFNYDKHKDGNPVEFLTSRYARDGDRSFEDPKFRIVVEMALARFTYVTPNVRKMIFEMEDFRKKESEMSRIEQAVFVARFQAGILESIFFLQDNQIIAKKRLHQVKELMDLRKRCDQESHSELFKRCQEIAPNF